MHSMLDDGQTLAHSVHGSVVEGTVAGTQKVVAGQSGCVDGLEQGISSAPQVTGHVGDGQEPFGWHQSPL